MTVTDLPARTGDGEQVVRGARVALQEDCLCVHCLSTRETTSSNRKAWAISADSGNSEEPKFTVIYPDVPISGVRGPDSPNKVPKLDMMGLS